MRRITVQARQLQEGDTFSVAHHDLFQGTVDILERTSHGVTFTTSTGGRHQIDLNHPVTVFRTPQTSTTPQI